MIDKSPYRKKLAKLFASCAILTSFGIAVANNLIVSGLVLDVNLIIFMIKSSILPAVTLGYIGFLIGRILDNKSVRARADRGGVAFTRQDIKEAYAIDSIFSSTAPTEEAPQLTSMFLDSQAASLDSGEIKSEI